MSTTNAELTIHIDGAARGNPGPAAFAYVITGLGLDRPIEHAGTLGRQTNNVAEYTALVEALDHARQLGGRRLHVYSDSELLVKQMTGEYKVKNDALRALYAEAQQLVRHFDKVTFTHVRREHNADADRLCNEVLDGGPTKQPRSTNATLARHGLGAGKLSASPELRDQARDAAIACINAALDAWKKNHPGRPSAEQLWDQLWSILEENRLVRSFHPDKPRRSRG